METSKTGVIPLFFFTPFVLQCILCLILICNVNININIPTTPGSVFSLMDSNSAYASKGVPESILTINYGKRSLHLDSFDQLTKENIAIKFNILKENILGLFNLKF